MLIRIVFAIDNKPLLTGLVKSFSSTDVQVLSYTGSKRSQWKKVIQSCADIIVISAPLVHPPVESGLEVLNNLPEKPSTILIHDSDAPEEHAVLLAAGADLVLYAGLSLQRLVATIETTVESYRQTSQLDLREQRGRMQPRLSDFTSNNQSMQLFLHNVYQVAPSNCTLLLLGETGTGKEHLAKAIHAESTRSNGPFVALNAAALPEQLLESELFGHAAGAFTGATRSRRGAFEMAHGGTIFLDEIGEMPFHLQSKLLRVLQDFEIKPIGAENPIFVDVRVITATNRDLEKETVLGNFRKDLFYRLSVMTLSIPPLRQRIEDIPMLSRRFLSNYKKNIAKGISYIEPKVLEEFCNYSWPGNVRELMNVIERAVLLCQNKEITSRDLPNVFHRHQEPEVSLLPSQQGVQEAWKGMSLKEVEEKILDQVETLYITMILTESSGRIATAAKIAGIHSRCLYNKMRRLGINKETFKPKKG